MIINQYRRGLPADLYMSPRPAPIPAKSSTKQRMVQNQREGEPHQARRPGKTHVHFGRASEANHIPRLGTRQQGAAAGC